MKLDKRRMINIFVLVIVIGGFVLSYLFKEDQYQQPVGNSTILNKTAVDLPKTTDTYKSYTVNTRGQVKELREEYTFGGYTNQSLEPIILDIDPEAMYGEVKEGEKTRYQTRTTKDISQLLNASSMLLGSARKAVVTIPSELNIEENNRTRSLFIWDTNIEVWIEPSHAVNDTINLALGLDMVANQISSISGNEIKYVINMGDAGGAE